MQDAFLEIIRADGRVQRQALADERVTVGRDPDAMIAVEDAPELERYHLLLAPRTDGCWVSVARTARTPSRRAGATFENGLLPWGAELDVGAVSFRFVRELAANDRRRRLAGPARKLVLLGACAWLAGRVMGEPPMRTPRTHAPAPALFAGPPPGCPGSATDARARAREAADAAAAKEERYPFSPRDGVAAAELWQLAAACRAAAGQPRDAADAHAAHDRLVARVEDDYRAHRLALERALDRRDDAAALREDRLLADLLHGRDGEYAGWLVRLDHVLTDRHAREKKR